MKALWLAAALTAALLTDGWQSLERSASGWSRRISPAKFHCVAIILVALALTGCDPGIKPAESHAPLCAFSAARIRIIGLTRIVARPAESKEAALTACIDMLDAYDSHIKAPGRFRLELYEFVPRSSEPRGKRLMIWPDIDLTDPDANNAYWQDYLRTYQFNLDMNLPPAAGNTFILEATCTTPTGKRLTDRRQIHTDDK